MNGPLLTLTVTVREAVALTPDVKRFHLIADPGETLPAFSPGAHVVVELDDGVSVRRNAYSLMGSPWRTDEYVLGVRRDAAGRGGSRHLHDRVGVGTRLRIGAPVNLFPLAQRARRHLLVAGGIGLTPFVAMAEQLARDGREFELHHAFRAPGDASLAAELQRRWPGRVRLYCSGRGERIDTAAVLTRQPLGTALYLCGPEAMMDAVEAAALGLGWPAQSLHREHFLAPARGEPYEVRLARSSRTVRVGEDQSMLEALELAGVAVPSLCRGGACGQCETRVVACDGSLMHADHFLSEAEHAAGTKVMPCVSRVRGRGVTLDL